MTLFNMWVPYAILAGVVAAFLVALFLSNNPNTDR